MSGSWISTFESATRLTCPPESWAIGFSTSFIPRRERIWLEPVHSECRSEERTRTLAGKPRGAAAPATSEGALPRGSVVHAAGLSRKAAQSASATVAGDVRLELELAAIAVSRFFRRLRFWRGAPSRLRSKLLSPICDRVRETPITTSYRRVGLPMK